MLFDLRSRRRRHTVRVVYLFLALIMFGGLVLVGVGTGNGNGGLLNAFTNNGSGSSQNADVSQATKAALEAVKKHPDSAKDWASLIEARWTAAASGSNYNSTTGAFDSGGKKQLVAAADAWQRYLTLSSDKPNANSANLAADVYQALSRWSDASTAWQYYIERQASGSTEAVKGYLCFALTSYAAKYKTKGDLASKTAIKLAPKADVTEMKSTLKSAASSATTAAQDVASEC